MSDWYYAHGGQQRGPVPVSELNRLADNGEFDPESDLVWRDGMKDWLPASSVEDLHTVLSPPPAPPEPAGPPAVPSTPSGEFNPYAAPGAAAPLTDTMNPGPDLPEIEPGSQPLSIGDCLSTGFRLTNRNFGMILAIGIIMIAINIGVSMICGAIDQAMGHNPTPLPFESGSAEMDQILTEMANEGSILSRLITGLVETFLGLGIVRIGLNIIDGRAFSVGMLFSQSSKLLRAYVAGILFGIMVGIGIVLLIVPGIYLAARFGQYQNAIVDRDMGILDAFSYSARITQGNKMSLIGYFILMILIILAGALALIVGLIYAIPLTTIAWLVAYRWLQYGSAITVDRG